MTVLDEFETMERAIAGDSLARFGDGELRLAVGGEAKSQSRDPHLQVQLRQILAEPAGALVCIPRHIGPKADWWQEYSLPKYRELLTAPVYGSAFVTRPDSAPWIDTPKYWSRVTDLWKGRDVVLVRGKSNSLTPEQIVGAASLVEIIGPETNAFASIDVLLSHTLAGARKGSLVLLCLGATATVMAWRLALQGWHAVDIGHIGMFMRHPGVFAFNQLDLISPAMVEANALMHADPGGYGGGGYKQAENVILYARELGARSLLDYGAGQCTLRLACKKLGWRGAFEEYDPAQDGIARLPKPADLVVCTDVLEHVEPDKLPNVLAHIRMLMAKGAYLTIATRPANKNLPDGRNAQLTVQGSAWWLATLKAAELSIARLVNHKDRELRVWVRK